MRINTKPTRNIYIQNKEINFNGRLAAKLFTPSKDALTLTKETILNKETLKWLQTNCKKFSKESLSEAYNSLLNSDNNVMEEAFNLLKEKIPPQKNKIVQIFQKGEKTLYEKFGLDFLSYLFLASKNNDGNHRKENLNFLDLVLNNINSNIPTDYLDAIVNSKDSDGNINQKCTRLFKEFIKNKNLKAYLSFCKHFTKLPEPEQDFISKHYVKHGQEIFTTLREISGHKSEAEILKIIDNDLKENKLATINESIIKSKDKNENIVLENYKKIITLYKSNPEILKRIENLKDNNGIIQDDAIKITQILYKFINKSSSDKVHYTPDDARYISKFLSLSKDSNGNVQKDYLENIPALLNENKKSNLKDIVETLEQLKNKKGEVLWDFVNIFTLLKSFTNHNSSAQKYNTFDKILEISQDSNGNIIPEIIKELPDLLKKNLLLEIPNIIKISKINNTLDKNNLKLTKELLMSTSSQEQHEMSGFILTCLDKTGNIDNNKINRIKEVQARGIKYNAIKIATALNNPDGTISKRGLDLIEYLKKSKHKDIEKDLPNILELCRDNKGFMSDNSIDCVKSYHKLNPNIQLSSLLKITLDKNKEVDANKQKLIIKILKDYSINDSNTILEIINAAKDKHGVVDLEVLGLASKLIKQGKNIKDYLDILPIYRKLYKYEHVTSLSQLNLRQKRQLMQILQRHQNDIDSAKFRSILNPKILPNNDSEYCSIMARISRSIGINVQKLSQKTINNFYVALNNLADPKQNFMNIDFDNNAPILNLDYSLKDFKNDVWNIVQKSHYSDRTKALDYLGFELKKNNDILELTGFPNAGKPDGTLASIKDKDVLNLIKKITPLVIKFNENNSIKVKNNPQLSQDLTNIIKAFPEFLTTIGKVQHETHDFTLDIHSLKVLQGVMKNPEFQNLNSTSRKHLQIIALLHDLTKAELKSDSEHPKNSAFDVYYLLNKLNMKEKDKLKIYQVIKKHDWLTNFDFSNYNAKKVAFEMRKGDSFKLLTMLTEADLKGVQKANKFYIKHNGKLEKARKEIYPYLYELQQTAINLPQTKFPKASKLNPNSHHVKTINKGGITNKVLYLKSGIDLNRAGFSTCDSTDDLNFLVHGLDSKDSASMFQALGLINSKALLSTSYINYKKGNYRAFRQEGFILDVPSTNIHVAYWRDFGSGYKKTIKDLFKTYFFNNSDMRNYISSKVKKELNLNGKEYIYLLRKIEDMPMDVLNVKYPKVAKAYKKIFDEMEVSKRTYGRNYNEILVTSPKIQAIFCYSKNPEDVSSYLRKYAEKNNIPIVVLG